MTIEPKNETQTISLTHLDRHPASIRGHVQQLIDHFMQEKYDVQRRRNKRFPYPQLLQITPLDGIELLPADEPISVVGKDISFCGLSFFHHTPIAFEHIAVALESPGTARMDVLINLRWCRFIQDNWYESGGEFIQVIERDSF